VTEPRLLREVGVLKPIKLCLIKLQSAVCLYCLKLPLAQSSYRIMRIKELELHNFRGIKYLHLVFNSPRNVVVLVGVNGVGKSSILECINLLYKYHHTMYFSDLYNLDLRYYNDLLKDSDIYFGSETTTNYIKVDYSKQHSLEWNISKKINSEFGIIELKEKVEEDIINLSFLTEDDIVNNNYFYYLVDRKVIELDMIIGDNKENIADFKCFSKWFREMEDLENEHRLSYDVEYRHPGLNVVRKAAHSLLGENYDKLGFKRAMNQLVIHKSGQEIAVKLLSDGEKSLLAMVGHLSRKLAESYQNMDNPLEASALVLIDEIELHLHPSWQRMIIPRLTQTFPNCQFIVTTHSPQVLSHVDPECIHILDYDGDNVIVKQPDSSYGLDSNRILEDILGVSKRPQEIQDRMSELFRTINNNDLEGAKEIVRELGEKIGISEPELVKAEATIKRREIIGR
jgi:predicted ATP-binding protein involved in virulence